MKVRELARQIVEFYEKISSWENSVVKGSGLTPSQMHTIEIVGHEGRLRMRELAEKKGVTTGTVTVTVDRLEKEGYLRREANEKDRRSYVIVLTDKGEALFRRHHEFHVGLTEEMATILSEEEMALFFKDIIKGQRSILSMDHHEQNFLEHHSDEFIEMAYSYERLERVENPDGYGKRVGDCGDTVEIFLTIDGETIKHVSIQIDGCLNTVACANTVATMTEGKTVEEAWDVTPEKVAAYLKTLEEDHFHCAELSVGAFFLALNDHRQKTRNGWKKTYSR